MTRFFLFAFFGVSFFYSTFSFAQQNTVELYLPNQYGQFGEVINVPVRVNGFTDIIAFQSSLNWDASQLKYIGVTDFGIKDLGTDDFNMPSSAVGHVRFAWDPTDAVAVTTADSTVLFIAQFEIIAAQNADITISFTDDTSVPAFPNEFADSDFMILPMSTLPGTVTAVSDYKDLVNINSDPNTSCNKKYPSGSLKADFAEDSLNFIFRWFVGNSVQKDPDFIGYKYENLDAGNYTLQILDENGAVFVESLPAFVADESNYQSDLISVISKSPQTSCSNLAEKQTGLIEITINDAQNPNEFIISWWHGESEQGTELTDFSDLFEASHLQTGDYEISAENKTTGCVSYHTENIPFQPVDVSLSLTSEPDNFCKDGANGSTSISLVNSDIINAGYFWFDESDGIDTTNSLHKGTVLDQLTKGVYKAWVIDYESECIGTGNIAVVSDEIYPEAIIEQKGSSLTANSESAEWFIVKNNNNIYLQETGLVYMPQESGYYFARIKNEYNCQSDSENLYYGITGLEDSDEVLSVFPNPFNNYIRVTNENGMLEFVRVFDAKGTLICEKNSIKNKFIDIPLTGSPDGIYFLYIRNNGKTVTRKIIKNLSK